LNLGINAAFNGSLAALKVLVKSNASLDCRYNLREKEEFTVVNICKIAKQICESADKIMKTKYNKIKLRRR
jgi:hypothetical protein